MKLKNIILWLLLCLAVVTISACGKPTEQPPEESTTASAISVNTEDQQKKEPSKSLISSELYVGKIGTVYVDPFDRCLRISTANEVKKPFANQVLDEFVVDGTDIWFSDVETGCVCRGDLNTGEVVYHYRLPFSRLVINGDMFYMLDTSTRGSEAILYRYNIADGEWETRVLSGCVVTDNRSNIVLTKDRVYFASYSDNVYSLYAVNLSGFDAVRLYTVPNSGYISELYEYNGKLCFSDAIGSAYRYDPKTNETEVYLTGAVRIYGMCDEGLLFKKLAGYSTQLFLGNAEGQSADVRNGWVLAVRGSRAAIARNVGGEYRVNMMKYPEDSEVASLEEIPIDYRVSGNYLLFFFNDNTHAVLWNLKTGDTDRVVTDEHCIEEVPIDAYLSALSLGVTPSEQALSEATPEGIMSVMNAVLKKNDRFTLYRLLTSNSPITPFASWFVSAFTYTKESDDGATAVFTLSYSLYADADNDILQYLPRTLKNKKVVLVKGDEGWRINADAS